MDKEQQIEEMEKDIGKAVGLTYEGEHFVYTLHTQKYLAKALYAADYRKQGDTVREFAEKLKEKFNGYEATYYNGNEESWHDLQQEIDELAAEFGAEVDK